MSEFFLSEGEKLKQILNTVKNFVSSNNNSIRSTQYYISLGDKKLLQVIEETLNDSHIDEEQKKEHIDLMKTFLEKKKNIYSHLSSSNDPESLEMKNAIEEAAKSFGFTGNNTNDIFLLELENTLERLEKKEITL